MKKALIHIGTYKTGSTSVQTALSTAARSSVMGSIAYPELDPIFRNSQHYLDMFYKSEAAQLPHFRQLAKSQGVSVPDLYEKYRAILASNDRLILSSELMSSFDPDHIRSLKRDLEAEGFTDFKVLMYLREPLSHYCSLLQEFIKSSRFCYQPSWHNCLTYAKNVVEWFSAIFEREVCVREFRREALVGGDVVTDFAEQASDFFGTSIALKSIAENETLSAEGAFILHEYRRGFPFSEAHERILFPETEELIGQLAKYSRNTTKISLHRNISDFIVGQNAKEAAWFKEKYGIDFLSPAQAEAHLIPPEPLRLREIIIKPDLHCIEKVKRGIAFPPSTVRAAEDDESRLIDFVRGAKSGRKVLYGGGAYFSFVIGRIWILDVALDFEGMRFVDHTPGVRCCRDFSFTFVQPETVDWSSVDEVLICAPTPEAEIRKYLLEKNEKLSILSIVGKTTDAGSPLSLNIQEQS